MPSETLVGSDVQSQRQQQAEALQDALAHCCGSENWYQHWMNARFRYTDGVKLLADRAGAYWLLDAIVSHQTSKQIRSSKSLQEFQLWELKVNADQSCVLTCRVDSDMPPVVAQSIEYTDFPLDYIKMYVEDGVILLPSEH
jgi:hypothetical protein